MPIESTVCGSDGSGTASDGTRHTVSPGTDNGSRLVANTATTGKLLSTSSTNDADAAITCSQLSSTINVGRSPT